jgi:hypothetical protein
VGRRSVAFLAVSRSRRGKEMAAATGMVMLLTAALAILAPPARALDRSEFPPGFLFGAATSAYQVSWSMWSLNSPRAVRSFGPNAQPTTETAISGSRLRARIWRTARASATGMSSPTRTVRHLPLSLIHLLFPSPLLSALCEDPPAGFLVG